jgi:ubiquinol-cytochrome c reductase cytochrome c subunit
MTPSRTMTPSRRTWLARVISVAGLALSACAYLGGTTAPTRPTVAVADAPNRGKVLYQRDCAWCHGADGTGTERAPDLVGGQNGAAFTDFMLSTGRMPLTSPDEPTFRKEPVFSRAEIADIVDYVAAFGGPGPPIPEPDPAAGDLGVGAELYQENCAACHSTTAIGGALTTGPGSARAPRIAPGLERATTREVAEAMLVGPGTMPVFSSDTFSAQEVDSIVRYVGYLQRPNDRGGASLDHVGPVTEGAVGWIVGLGLTLVVARWIGTKTGQA